MNLMNPQHIVLVLFPGAVSNLWTLTVACLFCQQYTYNIGIGTVFMTSCADDLGSILK